MTTPTLAEEIKSDIRDLESSLRSLEGDARMSDIRDHVEDLETSVNGMDRRIKSLRESGYAFEKDLEEKAVDFAEEWQGIAPNIKVKIEKEARVLGSSLRPLEREITQLAGKTASPATLRPAASKLKARTEALETRVEAAEESIRGEYNQFNSEVQKIKSHLSKLEKMLTRFSEATFELLATEAGIMAVKAVWAKNGKERKDDPEGILYLTDQRLLFEQKEEIATKKVLFVTTEKELVQELRWDIPVASIEEIKATNEGFMNKDDFIQVQLSGDAPFSSVYLHIWQSSDDWKILLKRAKAKEFDATRAIEIDKAVAKKIKDAPTECPSCNGALIEEILRGMDRIRCEYCGTVIRL
ncbi:MAG: hypothetical protein HN392_08960 [Anaerolineae bacterium]|jgi:predicted  nucleic acid-binding Zn-ribbon protein|nr:hypothetical protein [Anaerolineae bacterium]MBT7073536.1 hypothetical protein [Anaerolineae bacterium]MBT7781958.1 hypothetical protein [Anaerolineae bacterium]